MLYMSFETHNDSGLDKQDAVTVLFSIPEAIQKLPRNPHLAHD